MNKNVFENDIIRGMQQQLVKQAGSKVPDLSKAAECLHSALEIFEEQGLQKQADQITQLLLKIANKNSSLPKVAEPQLQSVQQLMQAGVSQRDLREFAKGNPIAVAKLNLVVRKLGMPDHEIAKFLGHGNVMTEEQANKAINPNEVPLGLQSTAKNKTDYATKGLTPEKEVKNLKQYGIPFNMPHKKDKLSAEDMDVDFADMLDLPTFDIDASDDELMGIDIKEDILEVFDGQEPMSDFEDEKD